ncbi:hypothetical protein JOB18_041580 [Solea senegalensis]|uniref:Uncharacterized protein n=1 Tax=Solea senegalensis TaxID=28829 RepID=A0AAV6SVJ7_SOLSE|nr:hypothetical protein JOB18_041580 [Solea senegalensis]
METAGPVGWLWPGGSGKVGCQRLGHTVQYFSHKVADLTGCCECWLHFIWIQQGLSNLPNRDWSKENTEHGGNQVQNSVNCFIVLFVNW